MIEDYLQALNANPFFCSHIILHFLQGYNNEVDMPLAYLVLPVILYEPSREKLNNANSNSSLSSIFGNSASIADLQNRIDELGQLSNLSMIVAHNHQQIQLSSTIRLLIPQNFHDSNEHTRSYFKAAYYLGIICGKERNYADIFRFLNVIQY